MSLSTLLEGFSSLLSRNKYFVLLVSLGLVFFVVNFQFGKFYANSDITLYELHPLQQITSTFSIWQQVRAFGLELGEQTGWIVPLSFFELLSLLGFSPLEINTISNVLLFVLPSISVYFLAKVIFLGRRSSDRLAFFAGVLVFTSFPFYILAGFPLFPDRWPIIIVPLLVSALVMALRTGQVRYWVLFIAFSYLNWGSFIGVDFLVVPFIFGIIYAIYYVTVESESKRVAAKRLLLASVLFAVIDSPQIYAIWHLTFASYFLENTFSQQYTSSLIQVNLSGADNSQLIYGIRLIGSSSWNQILSWTGKAYKPFFEIFTSNPIFVISSFLLPVLAFASLLWTRTDGARKRLVLLLSVSVVLLFFMKGAQPPLGEVYTWLANNIAAFAAFRSPYDKIAPMLACLFCIAGGYTLLRLTEALRGRNKWVVRGVAIVVVASLTINAYPIYSSEVMYPAGFFSLPSYYSQAANYVNSNPGTYNLLGLPETYYTMCYSWGYCGVGIDGVNYDKPVIEMSYTGSDIYDERMIQAVLDEVQFNSFFSWTINGWGTNASIYPNSPTSTTGINTNRLTYWDYLLKLGNIGQIEMRYDSTGAEGGNLNQVDWSRYNGTINAMEANGDLTYAATIGKLAFYDVAGFDPLFSASGPNDVYGTNNYDSMIQSTYMDARLDVISSLWNYNTSMNFVSSGSPYFNLNEPSTVDTPSSYIYAPMPISQYLSDLRAQAATSSGASNQSLADSIKLLSETESPSSAFVDSIQTTGQYDLLIRSTPAFLSVAKGSQIQVNDGSLTIGNVTYEGNGWYNLGPIEISSGINIFKSQIFTPSFAICALNSTSLDSFLTSETAPENATVSGFQVSRESNGSWTVIPPYGGSQMYASLCGLVESPNLDPSFTSQVISAFGLQSLVNSNEIMLLKDSGTTSEAPPAVRFTELSLDDYVVTVTGATAPFWLNFMQSFSNDWSAYSLGKSGSISLSQANYIASTSSPIFQGDHALLDGYANSWYVSSTQLSSLGLSGSGSPMTFSLLISYAPEATFSLALCASLLAGPLAIATMVAYEIRRRRDVNFPSAMVG